jgi:hypothetical protein
MSVGGQSEVTIPETASFASWDDSCETKLTDNDANILILDWSQIQYVDLDFCAGILARCSSLVRSGKDVQWRFRETGQRKEWVEESKSYLTSVDNGHIRRTLNKIEALWDRSIDQPLSPDHWRKALANMTHEFEGNAPVGVKTYLTKWIESQRRCFRYATAIGLLHRFAFFKAAVTADISILPEPPRPLVLYRESDFGPCLRFSSIRTENQLDNVYKSFADPVKLTEILGQHSNLGPNQSAALSKILVRELGRNIGDHTPNARGWITTHLQHRGERALLLLLIVDDGVGLINSLCLALDRDSRRNSVAGIPNRIATASDFEEIAGYAFDRFSSSKRTTDEILDEIEGVESHGSFSTGLYWVWTAARAYQGAITLRNGKYLLHCDFSTTATGRHRPAEQEFSLPGTMITVELPLRMRDEHTPPTSIEIDRQSRETASELTGVEVIWPPILESNNGSDSNSDSAVSAQASDIWRKNLREAVLKAQENVGANGLIIADFTGYDLFWEHVPAETVASLLLEMNYRSKQLTSAFVLWNFPVLHKDGFRELVDRMTDSQPELKPLRPMSVAFYSDKTADAFNASANSADALAILTHQGFVDLTTLEDTSRGDLFAMARKMPEHFHISGGELFYTFNQQRIRDLVWEQVVTWLEKMVETPVEEGGALRSYPDTLFRLPSSGQLVPEFVQMSYLSSNYFFRSRIGWIISEMVRALGKRGGRVITAVATVTRSSDLLLEAMLSNWGGTTPELIRGDTVEELFTKVRKGNPPDSVVFVTDVISSGRLCQEVRTLFSEDQWLGTVGIVDCREPGEITEETVLDLGADSSVGLRFAEDSGWTCSALERPIERFGPDCAQLNRILRVDRVSVSPFEPASEPYDTAFWSLWDFEAAGGDLLTFDHSQNPVGHHFVFRVDPRVLHKAINKQTSLTYLELVSERLADILSDVPPDEIVIVHPPCTRSDGIEIAKSLQRKIGAKLATEVSVDPLSRQREFGSRSNLNVVARDKVIVIVDDGVNSGDTLLSLLGAAIVGSPRRIVVFGGINRMATDRTRVFSSITKLGQFPVEVTIVFGVKFEVPVFRESTCPYCRVKREIDIVRNQTIFLRQVSGDSVFGKLQRLPEIGRARELFSLAVNDYSAEQELIVFFGQALDDLELAADLALVFFLEPELVTEPAFVNFRGEMEKTIESGIVVTKPLQAIRFMLLRFLFSVIEWRMLPQTKLRPSIREACRAFLDREDTDWLHCAEFLLIAHSASANRSQYEGSADQSELVRTWVSELWAVACEKFGPDEFALFNACCEEALLFSQKNGESDRFTVPTTQRDQLTEAVKRVQSAFPHHHLSGTLSKLENIIACAEQGIDCTNACRVLQANLADVHCVIHQLSRIEKEILAEERIDCGFEPFDRRRLSESLSLVVEELERLRRGEIPAEETDLYKVALEEHYKVISEEVERILENSSCDARTTFRAAVETQKTIVGFLGKSKMTSSDPSPDSSVLAPTALVRRFVRATMENLISAAYPDVSPAKLREHAIVEFQCDSTDEHVLLSVQDDGPKFKCNPRHGQQKALKEVDAIARRFGGKVIGPSTSGNTTTVSLELRKLF